MTQLQQFILDNKLKFTKGQRNANLTILVGFSLYNKNTIEEIKDSIPTEYLGEILTKEMYQEIERLYLYCNKNNYDHFWKTSTAKAQYKF